MFATEILPGLPTVPISELVRATGLTHGYLSQVRRGLRTPHPRHWSALPTKGIEPSESLVCGGDLDVARLAAQAGEYRRRGRLCGDVAGGGVFVDPHKQSRLAGSVNVTSMLCPGSAMCEIDQPAG